MSVLLNRFLVWALGLLLVFCFWLSLSYPAWFYFFAPLSLVATIVFILNLNNFNFKKSQFWFFLISPVIFLLGSWLFILFIENLQLAFLFSLIFCWLVFIFVKAVFLYLFRRPKYQPHALENISNYINMLSVFLFATGLFNLKLFLGFDSWYLLGAFPIIGFLLTFELYYVSNIAFKDSLPITLTITLIITEVAFAASYLPSSAYVSGLLVCLIYYLMAGLSRNFLLGIKERRVVARYLLICIICLLVILISAKWV